MALTMEATVVPTDAAAETSKAGKKAAKADFNADGTYHAYFGFQQTGSWIFRDEWYSDTLGIDGSSFKDTDINFDNGTLFKSDTNGITAVDGTVVTDAEITGNGTYTVSVEGLSGVLATDSESVCSMVYVDTDIPWSAKDNPYLSGKSLLHRNEVNRKRQYTLKGRKCRKEERYLCHLQLTSRQKW